ncbi:GlsB/YeaQ/YmgE family stress response membrane protein [Pyxidicoccus parkwayensis]|uniref:GlsB/YeaQ/YmgE family stress response membrane protein n=1 Tax=Pyxidicoccus parkwayensis TaxID=2813578 RepID=A0ABX7P3Q3_9BACT|nr:GlsB/YeaQ/YmgE family stress response membrane protein [Pyxidicoccus parkwaysis]QSQ25103.1 GlsB/YeaQ/YmgE family stress response membrane protein [Pyxidicoccus parkwaysis]
MGVYAFVIIGWVVGLISRVILPGVRHMGLFSALLVGMVGSIVGGLIVGSFNGGTQLFILRVPNIIGAVVGAMGAVVAVHLLNRKYAHA